ncbi:MAG: FkbM family methyltransferase [Verrucomicrobiaceae bacterium]|nr:FkbM family methyltransferase [Verrucomicrobiaceae bacterium]
MKRHIANLARTLTGAFVFRKTLPAEFGSERLYVTSRSDIRLLVPGWKETAGDLFRVVNRYVSPGDTVWDIGSNLGILAFCAALKSGAQGLVYSLEADPRYADIQTRTRRNFTPHTAQISILCAAAADQLGILDFVIPKNGHARNHLAVVDGNAATESEMTKQVMTVTLDWLLTYWNAPQFIKIDIEGAEWLAMLGASKLITKIRPRCYIECNEENATAMTQLFVANKYLLFSLDKAGNEQPVQRFEFNTIAIPVEQRAPGS